MKTKNILIALCLVFTVLFIYSCINDNGNSTQNNSKQSANVEKMDAFFGAKIAVNNSKDLKVVVSKQDILKYAEVALKDTKLNLIPQDYQIISENGKKYLRILSNDNYVSTVELTLEGNNYKVANTVCTSTVCASGGGCIPDGNYCTPCKFSNGLPSSDCTRTTTGG